MTKSELIGELDLAINHAVNLYGSVSINEPVKEIIKILVEARRRINLEGIDD